jgi:hypothetical protein
MGGQPLRREESELPGLPQIAESIMTGEHFAAAASETHRASTA